MYSIISSAAQWGLGFNYLKYKANQYHLMHNSVIEITLDSSTPFSQPLPPEPQIPEGSPAIPKKWYQVIWQKLYETFQLEKLKQILMRYISAPVIANLLGIIVGLTPLKDVLYGDWSIFQWIGSALILLGKAQIPVVLLILGVNMARRPAHALQKRVLASVIITRLFLFPLLGIGLTELAIRLGLMSADQKILRFVLMLEAGTPSAMNLVVMSQTVGLGVSKMANLQFWTYVMSVISLTFYGSVYLYLITNE